MNIPAFILYFQGYLTITVTGRYCERFINACTTQNILLWDIKKVSPFSIRCRLSVPSFRKLPPVVHKTGVSVHINIKHGFPFFLKRYKKRKLALCGIFIFLSVVTVLNQFVWKIEVTGNYKVPKDKIISVLNESGLKIGMPISKIDQQLLKTEALIKIPELAWLWVEKRGSVAIVDVREKIEVPKMYPPDDYTNIIAAKDALIERMTVLSGVPVVEEGDTVLAGTVLVTGKIPVPSKQFDRYVRADAKIYARVWYEQSKVFSLVSTERHETGRHKSQYTINFFGNEIPLFHKGVAPYKEFDVAISDYSLFGIGFTKKTYTEIELKEELMTEESVVNFGIVQMKKELEEVVSADSILKNFEYSYEKLNDAELKIRIKAEYLEDIAVAEQ